jgi:uncharacterized 2Fe-2S/4Fe-4S cluster protein (DUF4445 family)
VLVGEDEYAGTRPGIAVAQKDVRGLRLAKGTMRNSINVLLEKNGLPDECVQAVIAGASGTHALFRRQRLSRGNMLGRLGYNPK